MRINKYLALCGLGSRRGVEKYILDGRIKVNGQKTTSLSYRVSPTDKVMFDDVEMIQTKYIYYLVNKPVGYVCTNDDVHAESKITDLSDELIGLSIVGRLDKESEGLTIMTNDGDFVFSHQHPKNMCEKEYIVEVAGKGEDSLTSERLDRVIRLFKCGTLINGYRTRPARARIVKREGSTVGFNIILTEGRKRQIREVFEKEGIKVKKLKRIRIGDYILGDLELGGIKAFSPLDKA